MKETDLVLYILILVIVEFPILAYTIHCLFKMSSNTKGDWFYKYWQRRYLLFGILAGVFAVGIAVGFIIQIMWWLKGV